MPASLRVLTDIFFLLMNFFKYLRMIYSVYIAHYTDGIHMGPDRMLSSYFCTALRFTFMFYEVHVSLPSALGYLFICFTLYASFTLVGLGGSRVIGNALTAWLSNHLY